MYVSIAPFPKKEGIIHIEKMKHCNTLHPLVNPQQTTNSIPVDALIKGQHGPRGSLFNGFSLRCIPSFFFNKKGEKGQNSTQFSVTLLYGNLSLCFVIKKREIVNKNKRI
jgi:hypothetical protein